MEICQKLKVMLIYSLALTSKGTSPNIEYEGTGELTIGGASHPLEFKFKNEQNEGKRYEVSFVYFM